MDIIEVGRKIYYDKITGEVIVVTGEFRGSNDLVSETTIEQDFEIYKDLSNRTVESVGCIKLEYGEFRDELAKSKSCFVNLETMKLEFIYDDKETEEQVNKGLVLEQRIADLELILSELLLGI